MISFLTILLGVTALVLMWRTLVLESRLDDANRELAHYRRILKDRGAGHL